MLNSGRRVNKLYRNIGGEVSGAVQPLRLLLGDKQSIQTLKSKLLKFKKEGTPNSYSSISINKAEKAIWNSLLNEFTNIDKLLPNNYEEAFDKFKKTVNNSNIGAEDKNYLLQLRQWVEQVNKRNNIDEINAFLKILYDVAGTETNVKYGDLAVNVSEKIQERFDVTTKESDRLLTSSKQEQIKSLNIDVSGCNKALEESRKSDSHCKLVIGNASKYRESEQNFLGMPLSQFEAEHFIIEHNKDSKVNWFTSNSSALQIYIRDGESETFREVQEGKPIEFNDHEVIYVGSVATPLAEITKEGNSIHALSVRAFASKELNNSFESAEAHIPELNDFAIKKIENNKLIYAVLFLLSAISFYQYKNQPEAREVQLAKENEVYKLKKQEALNLREKLVGQIDGLFKGLDRRNIEDRLELIKRVEQFSGVDLSKTVAQGDTKSCFFNPSNYYNNDPGYGHFIERNTDLKDFVRKHFESLQAAEEAVPILGGKDNARRAVRALVNEYFDELLSRVSFKNTVSYADTKEYFQGSSDEEKFVNYLNYIQGQFDIVHDGAPSCLPEFVSQISFGVSNYVSLDNWKSYEKLEEKFDSMISDASKHPVKTRKKIISFMNHIKGKTLAAAKSNKLFYKDDFPAHMYPEDKAFDWKFTVNKLSRLSDFNYRELETFICSVSWPNGVKIEKSDFQFLSSLLPKFKKIGFKDAAATQLLRKCIRLGSSSEYQLLKNNKQRKELLVSLIKNMNSSSFSNFIAEEAGRKRIQRDVLMALNIDRVSELLDSNIHPSRKWDQKLRSALIYLMRKDLRMPLSAAYKLITGLSDKNKNDTKGYSKALEAIVEKELKVFYQELSSDIPLGSFLLDTYLRDIFGIKLEAFRVGELDETRKTRIQGVLEMQFGAEYAEKIIKTIPENLWKLIRRYKG